MSLRRSLVHTTLNLSRARSATDTSSSYLYSPSKKRYFGTSSVRMSSTNPDPTQVESQEPTPADVDIYLTSKILHPSYGNDPTLNEGLTRARENDLPEIQVSPLQGQFLSVLVRSIGAERVLEIGTLGGYSTTFLSKSLPAHGQIDTLELSPHHAKVAQENFLASDLYPFPRIHIGPGLDTLKKLKVPEEGPYDFVFIDANKDQIKDYFIESLRVVRKGGVVVVDNAIRRGKIHPDSVADSSKDVQGLRALYDWIEQDNGKTVLSSGIQTVGSKGWE
ncbi:uncharacterized protein L199_006620 [Kwoniella botswanensis]|uniref:uncharacterized protein n=1 Tax=Kwoniella botswanensis TaxID=1268659 RepID=UPI00315C65DF